MRRVWAIVALSGALLLPDLAAGHSGGLDAYGCHRNKKAGGYHCHRGPYKGREFGSKEEALRFFQGGGSSSSDTAPAAPLYATPATPAQPSGNLDAIADKLRIKSNRPLKTAGRIGYVCAPGASPAGIPSRRE